MSTWIKGHLVPLRIGAYVAAAALVFGLGYCSGRPNTTAARAAIGVDAKTIDTIVKVITRDSLRTIHDSATRYVPAIRLVAHTDTLLQHDTVFLHDTVAVQAVAANKAATAACNSLRLDCEGEKAGLRAENGLLTDERNQALKLAPNWFERHEIAVCATTTGAGVGIGAVIGAAIEKVLLK